MLVLVAGALTRVLLLEMSDPNSWQVFFVYSNMIKYKIVALLRIPSVMRNAVALVIGHVTRGRIPTTPGLRA